MFRVILLVFVITSVCNLIAADNRSAKTLFSTINFQVKRLDQNHDGRIDTWLSYQGPKNSVSEIKYDRNFDGKVDEVFSVFPGKTIRIIDSNYNGSFNKRYTVTHQKVAPFYREVMEELKKAGWDTVKLSEYNTLKNAIKVTQFFSNGEKKTHYEPLNKSFEFRAFDLDQDIHLGDDERRLYDENWFTGDKSYTELYNSCIYKNQNPDRLRCSSPPSQQRDGFLHKFSDDPRFPSLMGLSCQSESLYFTGTGLIIDKRCPKKERSFVEMEDNFYEGLNGLLQCFNPAASPTQAKLDHFPHQALYSAIYDSYIEMMSYGGIYLSCPNKIREDAVADACYSCKPPRIRFFTDNGYDRDTNAHEFIHLTEILGQRSVDNSTTYAEDSTPPDGMADHGDGWHLGDRVYNCTALCFEDAEHKSNSESGEEFDGIITQEICATCLSYPSEYTPGQIPSQCLKFPSQEQYDFIQGYSFITRDIDECEKKLSGGTTLSGGLGRTALQDYRAIEYYYQTGEDQQAFNQLFSCREKDYIPIVKTMSEIVVRENSSGIGIWIKQALRESAHINQLKSCVEMFESDQPHHHFEDFNQTEIALSQYIPQNGQSINSCPRLILRKTHFCFVEDRSRGMATIDPSNKEALECAHKAQQKTLKLFEGYDQWVKINSALYRTESPAFNWKETQTRADGLCIEKQLYCLHQKESDSGGEKARLLVTKINEFRSQIPPDVSSGLKCKNVKSLGFSEDQPQYTLGNLCSNTAR
ncbi:MAG: hypothetical protein HOE90_00055 [Bacteriovoracaceae bacterium]|jgi:hypothetical protein|nr:hypothetical protein [Bacteriovoracaceae bacterium]